MQSMNVVLRKIKQEFRGNSHFTLKGVRLGGCLFLFCLFISCRTKNTDAHVEIVNAAKPMFKSGDIIFRNGRDVVSRTARSFNRKDKAYSHCGIIQIENDSIFVYHELGGEYNPSQQLMRQSIENFCNPDDVDRFAVYRYPLSLNQKDSLKIIIQTFYKKKLPFDVFFNCNTDDRMYCSEFVFKCLNRTLKGLVKKALYKNESPMYIAIDDIYCNDFARLIVRKEY